MSDPRAISAPKTIQQRFGAQVGKFNHWYSDREGERFTLTFDRSVSNRVNLHVGSPDEPAAASTLYREEPDDTGRWGWFTNDGRVHRTLHEAAEHMISIRAEPRGEIVGGDATEVQGHPKALVGADYSKLEERVIAARSYAEATGKDVLVVDMETYSRVPLTSDVIVNGSQPRRIASLGLGFAAASAAMAAATSAFRPWEYDRRHPLAFRSQFPDHSRKREVKMGRFFKNKPTIYKGSSQAKRATRVGGNHAKTRYPEY